MIGGEAVRVNVYAEEVEQRVEIVETVADTGARFLGVRFYLKSASELHKDPNDDDSSAVTFWIRSGRGGYQPGDERPLHLLFESAVSALNLRRVQEHNKL